MNRCAARERDHEGGERQSGRRHHYRVWITPRKRATLGHMIRTALMLCGCLLVAGTALPCSIVEDAAHPRATPQSLVRDADAIVVAIAVRTIDPPSRGSGFPALPPDAFDV